MRPVAESRSEKGGPCEGCGMPIGVGNTIYKYPLPGATTKHGNGPGIWVCRWCKVRFDREAERRFTCVNCGVEDDMVVQFNGKILCPECYAAMSVEAGRLL